MSEQEHPDTEYGLVMPFVVCGEGKPFNDASFVAGWRCGMIDAALHANEHVAATLKFSVRAEELPQLDLIAMHRGYTMSAEESMYDWQRVTFEKGTGMPPSDGNETERG